MSFEYQFNAQGNNNQWGAEENNLQWFGGTLPAILGVLGYYKSNPLQLYFVADTIMFWIKSELYKIYYTSTMRG